MSMRDHVGAFADLRIWERVGDRLPWYYAVACNRMPAKHLIARRVPCELDLHATSEEDLWAEHARLTERFRGLWREVRDGHVDFSEIPQARPSLLELSTELAQRMLRHCNFCRWSCQVDRSKGTRRGTCQLESVSRVSSYFHHTGEELAFRGTRGSGTVFLTSCNLRCQFCLHPNTYLFTSDGPRRVSEVYADAGFEVEHEGGGVRFSSELPVLSGIGRTVRATKVFRHDYAGDLVVVEPLYAPPILVTPGHEVLAASDRGGSLVRVRASELRPGQYLAIPRVRLPHVGSRWLDVAEILAPLAQELVYSTSGRDRLPFVQQIMELSRNGVTSAEIGSRLGYNPAYVRKLRGRIKREGLPLTVKPNGLVVEGEKIRLVTEKRPGIPRRLRIDADLAEFMGYYCAEGYVSKDTDRPSSYNIALTFGRHEGKLVKRTAHLVRRLFGLAPSVVHQRTATAVEVGKTSLGLLLRALCGERSSEKKVPAFLFGAAPKVVESFLAAFQAGDGCVTNGMISLNTVSERLAMGLFGLYLELGHLPSFNIWEAPKETTIEGRTVRQSTLYYVKVRFHRMRDRSWSSAKKVRYAFREDQILVPIFRVTRVPYSGPVFNLEVDDATHTYAANFVAVGNCQNGDISHDKDNGSPVSPTQLAAMAWELRMEGCHNINWVGGEPTIHLHNIVEAIGLLDTLKPDADDFAHVESVKADSLDYYPFRSGAATYGDEFNAPMLWNSNFFMSPETMRILRPLVDVWLPDFKFGNDRCAVFLSRTPWYMETVSRNHKLVYDWGEDVVIRHLVMPGHVECCTKPVLRWIAESMPQALVNVMDQYHPDYACDPRSPEFDERYRSMARRPRADEILEAYDYAEELGLRFEEITFEKSRMGLRP